MKKKLKVAGIIVIAVGFAILIYLAVLAFITPNYDYASTPKPPDWINLVALLIVFTGLLLFNVGRRQSRKNLS